jgi:hypothetical protein
LRPPFHADVHQTFEFRIAAQQVEILIFLQVVVLITGLDGLAQ